MLKPVKRRKSPYYFARGTIDGKRVEVSTKCTTLPEARRECTRIYAERTAGGVEQGPDMSFETALRIYEQAKPTARFLEPISIHFRDKMVSEINGAVMRQAANALYPSASPATKRRQLYTPVKAILNMASEDGGFPIPRIKSPSGGNARTVFMVPDEAERLLTALKANANPYLFVLVTFLIGQGVRMSEALALQASDVSLDHGFVMIGKAKNKFERRITLIPRVIEAMRDLPTLKTGGTVFRRKDGKPFRQGQASGGQIDKVFARAKDAAGIEKHVTPHTCRHTWATWFYAQTKDVRRMQDEGGWRSGEWQRYTKIGTPGLGRDAQKAGWDFTESR